MTVIDRLRALQLKANIIANDQIGLMDINPEVNDGVAILVGEVESEEQKRLAESLAREIDGVRAVRNELQVVPPANVPDDAHLGYGLAEGSVGDTAYAIAGEYEAPGSGLPSIEQFPGQFTDQEIEEEVYERLATQDEVSVDNLEVSSSNQIVYLKGTVRFYDDLVHLQDIVLNTRGVMGISSEVRVREGEVGTPR